MYLVPDEGILSQHDVINTVSDLLPQIVQDAA